MILLQPCVFSAQARQSEANNLYSPSGILVNRHVFTVVVALLLAVVMSGCDSGSRPGQSEFLPWQIELFPDGTSQVLGIRLGHSTMAEVQTRLGDDLELALMVSPQESVRLEAFYNRHDAGSVTGKLLLRLALPAQTLSAMQVRAGTGEPLPSGGHKLTLAREDLGVANQSVVEEVAFIPSVSLDREIAVTRFGSPSETLHDGESVTHLLYPAKGLDLILNADGKDVLQYVAPKQFPAYLEDLNKRRGRDSG